MSALEKEIPGGSRLTAAPRSDWTIAEVEALFALPFNDLLYTAQWVHRQCFDANAVQVSTLLSIKTGACPEDCAYCPQSIRFDTGVERHELMPLDEVRDAARRAKAAGATRFCMGASYRGPKDSQLEPIVAMIKEVKALGLETCATLGLLRPGQAERLAEAGLDYYNHNLDSSADFYAKIISTRTYADRLETLARVRAAGVKVCCGGIVGMGETRADRVGLMHTLATLAPHPESVPINELVPVPGTPLAAAEPLDPFEFVRSIAVARVLMPRSHVRLSAGRAEFSDELQALCFFAGANSIFYGEKLLTTGNPDTEADQRLFARLGVSPEPANGASADERR
jgi:biotin synthase